MCGYELSVRRMKQSPYCTAGTYTAAPLYVTCKTHENTPTLAIKTLQQNNFKFILSPLTTSIYSVVRAVLVEALLNLQHHVFDILASQCANSMPSAVIEFTSGPA